VRKTVHGHLRGNLVAYLALFVALGGTSWAAVRLPKNSVKASQIAANAVRSAEIRRDAVGGSELRRGAVGGAELRRGIIAPDHLRNGIIAPNHLGNGIIAPEHLRNGIISPEKLAFSTDDAATGRGILPAETTVTEGDGFRTLATSTVPGGTREVAGSGAVQATDPDDGSDGRLVVRVVHGGHVEPGTTFSTTIPDGSTVTMPVSIQCNLRDGSLTFSIQAATGSKGSLTIDAGTIDTVSFKPIPSPP
jgi:hypothetical protein